MHNKIMRMCISGGGLLLSFLSCTARNEKLYVHIHTTYSLIMLGLAGWLEGSVALLSSLFHLHRKL